MNTTEPSADGSSSAAVPAPAMPEASSGFSRRSFLRRTAFMGAASLPLMEMMSNFAKGQTITGSTPTAGDVSLLQFLYIAESAETDLWEQYTELAEGNPSYRSALMAIDPNLPEYIYEDFRDEKSHRDFLGAYLEGTAGPSSVPDLSSFFTLQGSTATGANASRKRLTNLQALTIDTSYFYRYRGHGNPDFNDTFPQIATIKNQATIPPFNGIGAAEMDKIAMAAAFHFGFIEAGGSSLYGNLSLKAGTYDALQIMNGIGPTEFYHLATFMTSLAGVAELVNQPAVAADSMPAPCKFLSQELPYNSVLRPTSKAKAGAVATTLTLANDNLFFGQPKAFFYALTNTIAPAGTPPGFADNADAVNPTLPAGS